MGVAKCRADLGEVGSYGGGLGVGEGFGLAGLVGEADDSQPYPVSGHQSVGDV
jgi:hypothetical protein